MFQFSAPLVMTSQTIKDGKLLLFQIVLFNYTDDLYSDFTSTSIFVDNNLICMLHRTANFFIILIYNINTNP